MKNCKRRREKDDEKENKNDRRKKMKRKGELGIFKKNSRLHDIFYFVIQT